ncbi:hypothetical protein OE88DRAFT_908803 [Heliocybe sulcata]|uniref:DUF6699 domain-containing protein n=1 Tax=Heliocybe sulcata TaxID=5364 RepID=A0A5C3MMA9_9AGAM|nr:hypothetical protein OE88DRAFT_908803 [Heliocybe sulcata]
MNPNSTDSLGLYLRNLPKAPQASAWSVASLDSTQVPSTSSHGSASSSSLRSGYASSSSDTAVSGTPGAPYMRTVPLPSTQCSSTSTSIQIHPALRAPTPILYNPAYPLSHIRLQGSYAPAVLHEAATYPSTARLSLALAAFPAWTFTVENPHGVSVHDVLAHLERALQQGVGRVEWEAQSAQARAGATGAFTKRVAGDEHARRGGLRRVDFLGEGAVFAGVGPGSGRWEVYFVAQRR